MRLGLLSALAIGIHNFPEGMATFVAALHDTKVGIPIAIAIALHNIPEGIAVAVPIFHATKSRRKALYILISGISRTCWSVNRFFNPITLHVRHHLWDCIWMYCRHYGVHISG